VHIDYVMSAANLKASIYGIPHNRDVGEVAKMATAVQVPSFTPRFGVHIPVTDAEAQAGRNEDHTGDFLYSYNVQKPL